MSCNTVILAGILRDCATVNGAIGAEKDLILVNYDDFDLDATILAANREEMISMEMKVDFLRLNLKQELYNILLKEQIILSNQM